MRKKRINQAKRYLIKSLNTEVELQKHIEILRIFLQLSEAEDDRNRKSIQHNIMLESFRELSTVLDDRRNFVEKALNRIM